MLHNFEFLATHAPMYAAAAEAHRRAALAAGLTAGEHRECPEAIAEGDGDDMAHTPDMACAEADAAAQSAVPRGTTGLPAAAVEARDASERAAEASGEAHTAGTDPDAGGTDVAIEAYTEAAHAHAWAASCYDHVAGLAYANMARMQADEVERVVSARAAAGA